MRKLLTLALVLFAVESVWSQATPSAYTTQYRFRQYASGANPSADSLNANWTEIDSAIAYLANSQRTIGSGVGWIALIDSTAKSASIGSTNIPSTTANGTYRVSAYLETDVAGAGGDSVKVTLQWEGDDGENITDSTSTVHLNSAGNFTQKTWFIKHKGAGSVSIIYSTTFTDGGGSGTYLMSLATERLN